MQDNDRERILVEALRRIAHSDCHAGGTWVGELQQIAREALTHVIPLATGAIGRPGRGEGSVEISFTTKPDPGVRAALQRAQFRFSYARHCWVGAIDRIPRGLLAPKEAPCSQTPSSD